MQWQWVATVVAAWLVSMREDKNERKKDVQYHLTPFWEESKEISWKLFQSVSMLFVLLLVLRAVWLVCTK